MKYRISQNLVTKMNFIFQRLQLDRTISIDPLTLLEKISTSGISQDVCVNDLGKKSERLLYLTSIPLRLGCKLNINENPIMSLIQ